MTMMMIWMFGIGASVAALVVTAAMKLQFLHMAVAAIVSIFMALAAIGEVRSTRMAGGRPHLRTSTSLRYTGMVWCWGALTLLVTYAFILRWSVWVPFFIFAMLASGLCLFVAATLRGDEEAKEPDERMYRVGRGLAMVQLIASAIALIVLVFQGSFEPTMEVGRQFWAANNLFLFGALALGAISWNALIMESNARSAH